MKGKKPLRLSSKGPDPSDSTFLADDDPREPPNIASLGLAPDLIRFFSRTDLQSFLFHFLRESVIEETRFSFF